MERWELKLSETPWPIFHIPWLHFQDPYNKCTSTSNIISMWQIYSLCSYWMDVIQGHPPNTEPVPWNLKRIFMAVKNNLFLQWWNSTCENRRLLVVIDLHRIKQRNDTVHGKRELIMYEHGPWLEVRRNFIVHKGHFTHEPRAVTMKLWEPKRKCPKAIPTHLQNHVLWSRTLECSVKSYVTGPSTKCHFKEILFMRNFYSRNESWVPYMAND